MLHYLGYITSPDTDEALTPDQGVTLHCYILALWYNTFGDMVIYIWRSRFGAPTQRGLNITFG